MFMSQKFSRTKHTMKKRQEAKFSASIVSYIRSAQPFAGVADISHEILPVNYLLNSPPVMITTCNKDAKTLSKLWVPL